MRKAITTHRRGRLDEACSGSTAADWGSELCRLNNRAIIGTFRHLGGAETACRVTDRPCMGSMKRRAFPESTTRTRMIAIQVTVRWQRYGRFGSGLNHRLAQIQRLHGFQLAVDGNGAFREIGVI